MQYIHSGVSDDAKYRYTISQYAKKMIMQREVERGSRYVWAMDHIATLAWITYIHIYHVPVSM